MLTIIISVILLTVGSILSVTLIYLVWRALMRSLLPNHNNTGLNIKALPSSIFQKILRWKRYRKLTLAKVALLKNRSKSTLTELSQCFIFFPCSQGDVDEWTEHNYEVIRCFLQCIDQCVDQFKISITNLANLDELFERRINLVKIRVDNLRKLQRIRAKRKLLNQKKTQHQKSPDKQAQHAEYGTKLGGDYQKLSFNKNTEWAEQEILNMLADTNQELTLNMREIRAALNEVISIILQSTYGSSSNEKETYNDITIH